MCNLYSVLNYLLKSMFISLLLMMSWHWLCSNFSIVVFMTKKKKYSKCINVQLKYQHIFFFFLFLQNAYKCSCTPRINVVEVVPEHLYMSRLMSKPTKWLCPAKDQSGHPPSLIRVFVYVQWVPKDPSFLHADTEGSDQTGRMSRLIWVFAGRTCYFVGFVMKRLI